jgi:hypothetical protein
MHVFDLLLLAGAVAALLPASVAWTRRHARGAPACLAMQMRVIFPAVVAIGRSRRSSH